MCIRDSICAICVGVTYGLTVRSERDRIGGGDNYTQAMKYLEIKNCLLNTSRCV